jgi:hypothetical protein
MLDIAAHQHANGETRRRPRREEDDGNDAIQRLRTENTDLRRHLDIYEVGFPRFRGKPRLPAGTCLNASERRPKAPHTELAPLEHAPLPVKASCIRLDAKTRV